MSAYYARFNRNDESWRQLAKQLGVSHGHLYQVANGRRVSKRLLTRYRDLIGVPDENRAEASFAWRLSTAIYQSGESMRKIAHLSGVSVSYVHCLRKGKRVDPSFSVVASLARATGVSPAWLGGGVGDMISGQLGNVTVNETEEGAFESLHATHRDMARLGQLVQEAERAVAALQSAVARIKGITYRELLNANEGGAQ